MEKFSEKRYEALKEEVRKKYFAYPPVKCPALKNQLVYFTSEGFDHLIHKNKSRERNKNDQFLRFQLLDLAKEIIFKTTTIQEIEDIPQTVVVKMKKKKFKELRMVTFWGFIAITNKVKIKVIVKRLGKGKIIFWSVIPFWRTTKHGDNFFRDFVSGNLQED